MPSIYIKQLGGLEETSLKPIRALKGLTDKSEAAGGRQVKMGGSWGQRETVSVFSVATFTSTPRWAVPGWLARNLEAPADEQIPRQRKQASVGSGSASLCVEHRMLTPGLSGASGPVGLEPTCHFRLQPLGILSSGVTTKFNPSSATCWARECTNHLVL